MRNALRLACQAVLNIERPITLNFFLSKNRNYLRLTNEALSKNLVDNSLKNDFCDFLIKNKNKISLSGTFVSNYPIDCTLVQNEIYRCNGLVER